MLSAVLSLQSIHAEYIAAEPSMVPGRTDGQSKISTLDDYRNNIMYFYLQY